MAAYTTGIVMAFVIVLFLIMAPWNVIGGVVAIYAVLIYWCRMPASSKYDRYPQR